MTVGKSVRFCRVHTAPLAQQRTGGVVQQLNPAVF